LDFWRDNVDKILEFNEKLLLKGKGKISKAVMEQKVREIYQLFDKKRKEYEAQQADLDDLAELTQLEQQVKKDH